jgi:tryptophan 2,3-dioxygenase
MQTTQTQVWQPAPAMTAVLPGCQHSFAEAGPHYCSYIQVPGILASLRQATTADEQLLISYLAASTLWLHLQQRELAALEEALALAESLAPAQALLAEKRIERCWALSLTMLDAGQIVARAIHTTAPRIGFQVAGDLDTLPLAAQVTQAAARLHRQAWPILMQEAKAAQPAWPQIVANRVMDYAEQEQRTRSLLARILANVGDAALPGIALATLMPPALLAWAEETLRRHHPETQEDAGATDPLVFVIAHQLFEVWFPATSSALAEATHCLTQEPEQVLEATLLIRRAADLVQLWQRMIHLPQSMSAADYIAFRAELRGGSGAESEQFRQVELLAGLREPRYRQSLEQMHLLTPRLETLWQQTSLNEAILHLLAARDILSLSDPPVQQAEQLAAIWWPTGIAHSHADLAALCQAALNLDEQVWLWRQHHLAMVKAMIGGKPSIGAGGVTNHDLLTCDHEAQPVGGLPYLEETTSYRLFPVIGHALEYLQENWQAVASAGVLAE